MISHSPRGAVVLVGCGRLGSAILAGWLATGAVSPTDLIILTPSEKAAAEAARARGARVNPPTDALADAATVVLAVKPAKWREAVQSLAGALSPEAIVVSVMAGVRAEDIESVLERRVARVMPTTAVAQGQGVAALWSGDEEAIASASALFAPIADTVRLADEDQMDAATAVAGSAPAFIYAFVAAMARAGTVEGLSAEAATRLARGALRSAGAGLETGEPLEVLIARIASPGGTTRAGLDAMAEGAMLDRAASGAVSTAVSRARSLRS